MSYSLADQFLHSLYIFELFNPQNRPSSWPFQPLPEQCLLVHTYQNSTLHNSYIRRVRMFAFTEMLFIVYTYFVIIIHTCIKPQFILFITEMKWVTCTTMIHSVLLRP